MRIAGKAGEDYYGNGWNVRINLREQLDSIVIERPDGTTGKSGKKEK